jgi:hypothetical protein
VRVLHAAVRHLLGHAEEIEALGGPAITPVPAEVGLPISQFHLLGTLFSFSVQSIDALARTGVELSAHQAEAYVHTWNLIGHQMGIRDDLLPLSYADATTLWDEHRRREYGPTEEGRALTAAAIECMRTLFGFRRLPGLPASGIRHFVGDDAADMLGVPRADWTRLLFRAMGTGDRLDTRVLRALPGVDPAAAALGRRVWQGFEAFRRDGRRPAFEVTEELREAWGLWAPRTSRRQAPTN